MQELAARYGLGVVEQVMDRMLDTVEAGVKTALRALPDGIGEAEGYLDDDGRDGPPTRVHARVEKRGERLFIDLSGSDSQVGGAMNVPWASARAGIVYAVRAMVAPGLGSNDGLMRAVEVDCPLGSVLNPVAPAAVSVRHNTCQRFADTLIRAMADLWPEKAVASSTVTFFCMNVGSSSPLTGRTSVMADVVGGGTGATAHGDGIDGVDTYMSNVGVMPAEVVETNYQIRVLRSEFLPGSQGVGKFNGGLGLRREYEILGHAQRATFYAEQTRDEFAPRGAAGGFDAAPTTITVTGADGVELTVPTKTSMTLQPGTVVRVETAGGGGFGNPTERSAELRDFDIRNDRL
jgi:N-methylhydantoinase B